MKKLIALFLVSGLVSAPAALINIDLSPPGTDNAVGLSPANESSAVIGSTGSGNEIETGITFDTETLELTVSLGYGSAFGFADLTGAANAAHIHGPAPTNTPASVLINLAGLHVLAAPATTGGSIVGTLVLTPIQADELLAGLYYVNVHTAMNPPGEIRGQLIPVNTFPTVTCPAATNVPCTGDGTLVGLTAEVADDDGDALSVLWLVDGNIIQTNDIPAGTNGTLVTFDAVYDPGTHTVTLVVFDGIDTAMCSTTVTVTDTTPPVITAASADPGSLWPPNHKMKRVELTITAIDACDPAPTCRITSIASDEPVEGPGKKNSPDWAITGDLTAKLRAERLGKGDGRTYTLTVECSDSSGNVATTNVVVLVPHDKGKKNGNNGNGDSPGNSESSNGKGPKKPKKNK